MIPIIISVRGLLLTSIIVGGLAAFVITNSSKAKEDYQMTTGKIEYLEKEYQHLPTRNIGDYRYLKIDNYPYLFEIYEPNSLKTAQTIDNLKTGDTISIYYYETSNTELEGLNRYAQFIDRNSTPYFVRDSFQKQLGFVLIGLALLINIIGFILWKTGKLGW